MPFNILSQTNRSQILRPSLHDQDIRTSSPASILPRPPCSHLAHFTSPKTSPSLSSSPSTQYQSQTHHSLDGLPIPPTNSIRYMLKSACKLFLSLFPDVLQSRQNPQEAIVPIVKFPGLLYDFNVCRWTSHLPHTRICDTV